MIFVYHYVIIPFDPQHLPKHAPLILQGAGCKRAGCLCLETLKFTLLISLHTARIYQTIMKTQRYGHINEIVMNRHISEHHGVRLYGRNCRRHQIYRLKKGSLH